MASRLNRLGLGFAALVLSTVGAEAQAQARPRAQTLHPSLGATSLLEDDSVSTALVGPGHVKVVEKDRRLALEGATSVVEASLALGAWHLDHSQLEQAMKVVEAGLKQASKDESLLAFAGAIAIELGEPDRALRVVQEASKGSNNHLLHYVHGRALARLGRSEDAAIALEEAVRLAPGNSAYQVTLGILSYELHNLEAATLAFRAARELDRSALVPASNLGVALFDAGQVDEAFSVYSDVTAITSDDPRATQTFANLGAIHLRNQDWDEAESAYASALRLDPDSPDAAYNHAYLLHRRGELVDAYQGYERALKLDPALPVAYLHLGEMDLRRGDAAPSVRWLEAGASLSLFDDSLARQALVLLGDAYRELGDPDASLGAFRKAFALAPEDLKTIKALSASLRARGEGGEARALLEDARKRMPGNTAVLLELAALARVEGDSEQEKSLYREVLVNEGENDATWLVQLNLALILLREGETAEARARLEPLLRRVSSNENSDSDSPLSSASARMLSTTYGMLVAHEGDLEEASRRFQEVIRQAGTFTPALEALAVVAALEGNLDGARVQMTELRGRLQGEGDDEAAMVSGNLGLVLWLDGRFEEARAPLSLAVQKFPEWVSARAALGEVELSTGRFIEAVSHASEAQRFCADESLSGAMARGLPARWLHVTLGGDTARLCERVSRDLGSALVATALTSLHQARSRAPEIRSRLDQALALPLHPIDLARARFVRGTLELLEGAYESARQDLTAALSGVLDATFRPAAENNLGIALHNLGRISEAEGRFEIARTREAAATLNLGIVYDERNDNAEALRLYQAYVSSRGVRGDEVLSWIENLQKVQR